MSGLGSVIVTGAASGIGAATAQNLLGRGLRVVAADIAFDRAVEPDPTLNKPLVETRLDVGSPDSWDRLLADVDWSAAPLVGLVNNAGISQAGGIMATSDEAWRRVHRVNLDGVFYGMRAVAPLLRDAGGGSIVNVSSAAGLVGYHEAAYTSSKWAIRGLSKSAAAELARWGIRVNSVHPGLVGTPMAGENTPYIAAHLEAVPAGSVATPDQVAAAIAFLIGDESQYVSATELAVDGGFSGAGAYHAIRRRARELRDSAPDEGAP